RGAERTERGSRPESLRVVAARHHDLEVPADAPDLHLVRVVDSLRHARAGTLTELGRVQLLAGAGALGLGDADLRVAATEYAELAAPVPTIFHIPHPSPPTH